MSGVMISGVEAWWHWMAGMSVQVAIIFAVVAVLERLLYRFAWPQLLAALWLVVFVKLVLPPSRSSPWSLAAFAATATQLTDVPTPKPSQPWLIAAFLVWLIGVLGWAWLAVNRYRRLMRELERSRQIACPAWLPDLGRDLADRLRQTKMPTIIMHDSSPGPAVVGFFRPIVLLPSDLRDRASRIQIEHVLLHEFAHVKRRDIFRSSLLLGLQLLYWFHPLIWLARKRAATFQKICCDQVVLASLAENGHEYRRTLLQFARVWLMGSGPHRLGFIHPGSVLLARLDWLARPIVADRCARKVVTAGLLAILLAACVPLARPVVAAVTTVAQIEAPQTEGCLHLRYLVFGMMEQDEPHRQLASLP